MATCAHTTCTCEAREGSDFCADWCAANAGETECHCHHPGCEAPHHH